MPTQRTKCARVAICKASRFNLQTFSRARQIRGAQHPLLAEDYPKRWKGAAPRASDFTVRSGSAVPECEHAAATHLHLANLLMAGLGWMAVPVRYFTRGS